MPNFETCEFCGNKIKRHARKDARFCDEECKDKWYAVKRKLERKRVSILRLLNDMATIRGQPGADNYLAAMADIETAIQEMYDGVTFKCLDCEQTIFTKPTGRCDYCGGKEWRIDRPTPPA